MTLRIASSAHLASSTFALVVACSPTPAAEAPSSAAPTPSANIAGARVPQPPVVADAAAPSPSPEQLAPDHVRSQADCPEGMVFIPGGHFTYRGPRWDVYNNQEAGLVTREFDIKPFCIDQKEVMSVALESSCAACRKEPHNSCSGLAGALAATCITQDQAALFCQEGSPGTTKRLPAPEEWLYAALGTDGRRFPWGNTWFPWGNDRWNARPSTLEIGKTFCDLREPQLAERLLDPAQCWLTSTTLDISPFGVENMGSNVLELTSAIYELNAAPRRSRRCPVFGLNHAYYNWNHPPDAGPPPQQGLVESEGVSCDQRESSELQTNSLVGFRCATSKRSGQTVAKDTRTPSTP